MAHEGQLSCGTCVKMGSPVSRWARLTARSIFRSSSCISGNEVPTSPSAPQPSRPACSTSRAAIASSGSPTISSG